MRTTSVARTRAGKSLMKYTRASRNLNPTMPSSPCTKSCKLTAMTMPSNTPTPIPSNPIKLPCTTNTSKMLRGEDPNVRKMAMSRRLSFTTMTMVDTMLNAATATISDRMKNRMRLVIEIERKKFACSLVQSCTSKSPPIEMAAAREILGAAYMSDRLKRMPVTSPPMRKSLAASGMATMAIRRSYSYMPMDRMPVTSKARILGMTPSGVTSPKATSSTTRSPTLACNSSASADPSITRYLPSVRSLIRPLDKCGPKSTTRRSASGNMPRNSTPEDLSP